MDYKQKPPGAGGTAPGAAGGSSNGPHHSATLGGEQVLQTICDDQGKPMLRLVLLPDGLFAIDLECPETLAMARHFLPKIPLEVRDRPGRPNSRWVYREKVI
jgi:hypothetical protein